MLNALVLIANDDSLMLCVSADLIDNIDFSKLVIDLYLTGVCMIKKITLLSMLIIILITIFFEYSKFHHNHKQTLNNNQYNTFEISHTDTSSEHSMPTKNHCSGNICQSGFCNLFTINTTPQLITRSIKSASYKNSNQHLPKSPFLLTHRKPPKSII